MRSRILLALIFAANIAVGCSTHRAVINEVTYDDRTGRPITVERETTTTERGTEDEGALSETVNAVVNLSPNRFAQSVAYYGRFSSCCYAVRRKKRNALLA